MKAVKCLRVWSLGLVLVVTANAKELVLSAELEQYKVSVRETIGALPAGTDPAIAAYLQACLEAAAHLNGYEAGSAGVSTAMRDVAGLHNAARTRFLNGGLSGHAAARAEQQAYVDHLQEPFLADNYLAWVELQNALLDRKYFKTETSKTSNFLEGYVNGQLKLTRADPDRLRDPSPPRPLGVSPWEAIFRLEPTLAVHDGPRAAIMGSAGLTKTMFPLVKDAPSPPHLVETPASQYLKKAGVRLGVGVGYYDDKSHLLLGAGIQLSAVGIWALYEPSDETWLLGLSMADLSKLKNAFGWFN